MFETPSVTKDYVGVIDIGSNSIRLVVFSGKKRVPDTIFNEKIMVGLGAEIGKTGKMGTAAIKLAISTLQRFVSLCTHMGVGELRVLATAAVRDASNGAYFVKKVKTECDLDIRIIMGEEEARLSALGVLSGDPRAHGISGDLGGGSLELARIKNGAVHETISLPIGPLRLMAKFGRNRTALRKYLHEQFEEIPWLDKGGDHNLYLVGGAWRNIAQLMIREQSYPLPILQGYYSSKTEFTAYCRRLSKLDPDDIPFGSGLTARRREVLPTAAIIMIELMYAMKARRIVASAHGLREGVIFDELPEEAKKIDPFMATCHELANERCRFPEHSKLIYDWTRPLFYKLLPDKKYRERLQMAICLLSDIAWRGHPDFRAEKAVSMVLHSNLIGVSHKERCYIAVALNQAYGASIDESHLGPLLPLLKIEEIMEARTMGAAVRLAQRLSGGTVKALTVSSLRISKARLYLSLPEEHAELKNDIVHRRLRQLAQLVGRSAKIEIL
ncbi:Ppx/GppA family phosphatase [Kordiimonas pumila]|uniref:Ppx/GppA family phosphatase n=1 Tax=Kordiimonas pumila TaxID=2161677 RepID=A0ABV7D1F7_9PROT|nr:Ppx/GppA family phosphatase [Kordiimonas pumila]